MSLRIILIGTKDSANVGSTARAMKNFGLSELRLVRPRCRIDERAYALASHAGDVLQNAVVSDRVTEALRGITYVIGTTARPRASERNIVLQPRAAIAALPQQGGALLFGPEDSGLSNQDLDRCQAFVTIPTSEYASINLAQAANILAYEWFLARQDPADRSSVPATERNTPAPREEVERMYTQLLDLLHYISYTDGDRAAGVEHIFRRLLDRAQPSVNETAALRGIWRQAKWAADQQPDRIPGRRAGEDSEA